MEAIALIGQSVGIDVFRADAHEVLQMIVKTDTTATDSQLLPGDVQVCDVCIMIV
jgi:hypothetical protein